MYAHRPLVVFVVAIIFAFADSLLTAANDQAASPSLTARIDEVTTERVPVERAAEHEWLRRVHLDLIGRLPSLEEVESFLEDDNPTKRRTVVDRLLASEEFNRFFTNVLDVMLMERRAGKRISQAEWTGFLERAVTENWGYDRIVRTIIDADGVGEFRGAAKFLLDREVEPNALTRDISRIFMGRDLQCAQCHDHPNIDDYLQSEYYGLFAFVNRSYLFENPAENKKAYLGERAEGEAEFQSVFFTDEPAARTIPRLLNDLALDAEPPSHSGKDYLVTPDKNVAGKPAFSRRLHLARLLTDRSNYQFARTAANRFWAHMLGKGLVDPVDFDHSANPAGHPALVGVLTEGMLDLRFDIREYLRAIAMSDVYARSIDIPTVEASAAVDTPPDVLAVVTSLAASIEAVSQELDAAEQHSDVYFERLKQLRVRLKTIDDEIATTVVKTDEQTAAKDKLAVAAKELSTRSAEKNKERTTLEAALKAVEAKLKQKPDDKELEASQRKQQSQLAELDKVLEQLKADLDANSKALEAASQQIDELQMKRARLLQERVGAADRVAEARGALRVVTEPIRRLQLRKEELKRRLDNATLVKTYIELNGACADALAQLEVSTAGLAQLEKQVAQDQELQRVSQQLADRDATLVALQAKLTELEQQANKLTEVLGELDAATQIAVSAWEKLSSPGLGRIIEQLKEEHKSVSQQLAMTQMGTATLKADMATIRTALTQLSARKTQLQAAVQELATRRQTLRDGIDRMRDTLESQQQERDATGSLIQESWQRRYLVRELKPLSPEQLAGATIAGLNLRPRFVREAEAEWKKSHKDVERNEQDDKQTKEVAVLVQKRMDQVLSTYVSLFAAPAGAPQDVFSSTADQALFLTNDGRVQSWLSASEGTLIHQLNALESNDELTDTLYWAMLTRPPTEEEKRAVAEYLQAREESRSKAIQEIAWSLLASVEFRFNH